MKKLKQQSKKHTKNVQQQPPSSYGNPSSSNVPIPVCCQLPAAGCPGCYPHYSPNPTATCQLSYVGASTGGSCSCRQQVYQNSYRSDRSSTASTSAISKPTNIVATMELFEPRASTSGGHVHHHQDYSYAYYEPGVALRHSNVPSYMFDPSGSSPSGQVRPSGGSSSMRALMALGSNGQRNRLYGGRRNVGRFPGSPCENIYEEIIHEENEQTAVAGPSSSGRLSLMSLNQSVIVEEEFRQVQNCHRKVLGELNLSVEAMLMPVGNGGGRGQDDDYQRGVVSYRRKSYGTPSTDLDSGFSGSSGSASYIGNLRARKTEARMLSLQQQSHHQSMMLFEGLGQQEDTRSISSCNSMDRSSGGGSVRALCSKGKNLSKLFSGSTRSLKKMLESSEGSSRKGIHSTPSSPTFVKSNKVGFWSKKSWTKKLSSNGALHRSFEGE